MRADGNAIAARETERDMRRNLDAEIMMQTRIASAPPARPCRGRSWVRALKRTAAAILLAAAALPAIDAVAPSAAYACQSPSWCRQGGNCQGIGAVSSDARRAAGSGYDVVSARLKTGAPTASCLWYEVVLRNAQRDVIVYYYDVNGRRVR